MPKFSNFTTMVMEGAGEDLFCGAFALELGSEHGQLDSRRFAGPNIRSMTDVANWAKPDTAPSGLARIAVLGVVDGYQNGLETSAEVSRTWSLAKQLGSRARQLDIEGMVQVVYWQDEKTPGDKVSGVDDVRRVLETYLSAIRCELRHADMDDPIQSRWRTDLSAATLMTILSDTRTPGFIADLTAFSPETTIPVEEISQTLTELEGKGMAMLDPKTGWHATVEGAAYIAALVEEQYER